MSFSSVDMHPELDTMYAYIAERNQQANRHLVQHHLARCRACAVLLLAIWAFVMEAAPDEWDISDNQIEEDWRKILVGLTDYRSAP